jgi:hypothetical protein
LVQENRCNKVGSGQHGGVFDVVEDGWYSLRSIILFTNLDVSRHILVVDTSVLAKSNMGRREYMFRLEEDRRKWISRGLYDMGRREFWVWRVKA